MTELCDKAFLDFMEKSFRASYAQRVQDLFAFYVTGCKEKGTFVEFGALNGIDFSNSYLLERLGWKGVVCEPHPNYAALLKRHRTCRISTKCVLDRSGDKVTFRVFAKRPAASTVAGYGVDRGDRYTDHEIETISLNDLLEEAQLPEHVDFLSIDTEGSELKILEALNFSRHRFGAIAVEHNYTPQREKLLDLLQRHGYVRIWTELSGHDDWYVHESATAEAGRMSEQHVSDAVSRLAGASHDRGAEKREATLDKIMRAAGRTRSTVPAAVIEPPLKIAPQPKQAAYAGTRSCAILQMEAVHEEIIPSLVKALNANGFRPSILLNMRCSDERGDIFRHFPELDFNLQYVPITGRADWTALADRIESIDPEFLLQSTFQRDGIAQWSMGFKRPVIGVVHNVRMFLNTESCRKSFEDGRSRVLTLAPHVAVFLNQRVPAALTDRIGVIEPSYWGPQPDPLRTSTTRIAAIPGGVNFKTRDHKVLLDTLSDPALRRKLDKLTFKILGGGADRAEMEDHVRAAGLAGIVDFAPLGPTKRVLYDDYIGDLRSADLLHPLAPLSFVPYREHKITSAVPTAVGFNLPMVLDRWTGHAYRVPSLVSDAPIQASLERLADASNDELTAQRLALRAHAESSQNMAAAEMKRLIAQL